MRKRLRRLIWATQRFRAWRLLGLTLIIVGAAAAAWLYSQWDAVPVFGVAAVFLAGLLLAHPIAALARRLFVKAPPWRQESGRVEFAGAELGMELYGSVLEETPMEIVERLGSYGGRFADGRFSLVLWLIAADGDGNYWTIVQEQQHRSTGRTIWTASVDGSLSIADLDESGRPNPFRAAHRLAKSDLDVPLVDITLAGWGREHLRDGNRDVAVGFARTSVSAERLRGISYPRANIACHAHLVTLDQGGTAKTLGWGLPSTWHGGAVYGLLETLENVESGSWAALERAVAPRWHNGGMFARVDRETEHLTGRLYSAS